MRSAVSYPSVSFFSGDTEGVVESRTPSKDTPLIKKAWE